MDIRFIVIHVYAVIVHIKVVDVVLICLTSFRILLEVEHYFSGTICLLRVKCVFWLIYHSVLVLVSIVDPSVTERQKFMMIKIYQPAVD